MKVKKKFKYEGVELRIVEREETYMNSESTMTMTRVLAPNGGVIPVKIQRKQTLKSIAEETVKTLDNFKSMGADVKTELLQRITDV
jgi:hypothetical protein